MGSLADSVVGCQTWLFDVGVWREGVRCARETGWREWGSVIGDGDGGDVGEVVELDGRGGGVASWGEGVVEGAGGGFVDDDGAGEGEESVDFLVGLGCRQDDDGGGWRLGRGGGHFCPSTESVNFVLT